MKADILLTFPETVGTEPCALDERVAAWTFSGVMWPEGDGGQEITARELATRGGYHFVCSDPDDVRLAVERAAAVSSGHGGLHCPECGRLGMSTESLWLHYQLIHSQVSRDSHRCPLPTCEAGVVKRLGKHLWDHFHSGIGRGTTIYKFSLLVVRDPSTQRFLLVQEVAGMGWWLPGGGVDPGETFTSAATRECDEEAGVKVTLKGILAVEDHPGKGYDRMRIIFYAEPVTPGVKAKRIPDGETSSAVWVSLPDLEAAADANSVKLRGYEPLHFFRLVQSGATVYPMALLG